MRHNVDPQSGRKSMCTGHEHESPCRGVRRYVGRAFIDYHDDAVVDTNRILVARLIQHYLPTYILHNSWSPGKDKPIVLADVG
jgi:hypothetical protein